MFERLLAKWKLHSEHRQAIEELNNMTDRELQDIGVHRSQIENSVRGYDK